jgi:hypothetical protein
MTMRLYERVRIRKLIRADAQYDGWGVNKREPQEGDIGWLIDLLHAPNLPDKYVVEKSDPHTGETIWLADFYEEELEPIDINDEVIV